ncbi:MAG: molybdopterin-dependent oxidoreductase [Gemmatimonadetes bacterium]|nr:molybdopterin-dependent oxidoreductase [Gemmatimonadota bacterium]
MPNEISRRTLLQRGAAAASFATIGGWERAFGALGTPPQGEEVIAWTDVPANFNPRGALDSRTLDASSFITPNESFYLVQHYGTPQVDAANYRLKLTGLFNKPLELTLDELKKRPRFEQIVGFECGGNSNASLNRLAGNARWTGTRLRDLLRDAGLDRTAHEVVFFGADKGMETVTHGRGGPQEVEQHFGRSLTPDDAMRPEVIIAWEMNGVPLPPIHGFPVRLVVPGWYGVANVKWMDHIHAQDSRYVGRFMSRDYVTLKGEQVGDKTIWNESLVARIRVKSMVARLTRSGTRYTAHGFALAGALPFRSIEVRVDDGPWQRAKLHSANTEHSWQLFTHQWSGLAAGEHTIVSRATDANGVLQPEQSALAEKKTMWENNGQFVRKFTV